MGADQLVAAPADRVLGEHPAVDEDEDAVAAAQVVAFVGDDEDLGAVPAGGVHAGEQGLLGLHVDARGGIDEDQQAGGAEARAVVGPHRLTTPWASTTGVLI
jgi:hypothetical protein